MIKKYKLTTNLSLKIVAFVFAAFLWLIVANVDNPVVRNTYANIPVTIVNEDVITQGGEVYSVLDEQNVNVVVYAKRSVIQQISSDEIVATADIKEMDAHTRTDSDQDHDSITQWGISVSRSVSEKYPDQDRKDRKSRIYAISQCDRSSERWIYDR